MKNIIISFLLLIYSNLLVSCSKESDKSITKEILSDSLVVNENKEIANTLYAPMPVIGTTDELEKDTNCEQETIHTYAETKKEHIYLCGDESIPKFLVIIPIDRNLNKIVIKEKPLKILYSYRFKQGEVWHSLRRPSPIFQSASFSSYDYLRDKTITDQHVSRYLFNKRINPNYQKSFTPPDKRAKEDFLKFLPTFRKQVDTCHSTLYGERGKPPKSVSAYKIAPESYLIQMICLGGSYNFTWQYVLYSENSSGQRGEIVKFHTLRPPKYENIEAEIVFGQPQFYPEDNTLTVFSKGRNGGGCGSFAQYKLIDGRFELQEFRDKDCDNRNWQIPEEFPKIYP